jgi:hypothetical protein
LNAAHCANLRFAQTAQNDVGAVDRHRRFCSDSGLRSLKAKTIEIAIDLR